MNFNELKKLAKKEGIITKGLSKNTLTIELKNKINGTNSDPYTIVKQLGSKGKDANVYLVRNSKGKLYASKQFRKNKNISTIKKEVDMQKIAASIKLSPKIIEYDLNKKYIIMQALDKNLFDLMKKKNGKISQKYQKEMLKIFKTLDQIGIFHKDPSPLNFMLDSKDDLYIIDFGMASNINKQKDGNNPNYDQMTLGMLLKLRSVCPDVKYKVLEKSLAPHLKQILEN
jgi:serine/threonine protein kinase